MKPILPEQRRVASIHDDAAFAPFDPEGLRETGTSFLKLNPEGARDVGFYIYRMAPGARSAPHRHGGAEEFLILEGELIDNDGTVYRTGDVVWLAPGTEHTSHTETGCLIAVYAEAGEEPPGGA
ncbi:cupin domain-containing protein [Salipiger sp. P9]|uniref:cupin domain-containing protein n=1 Tax=Salipiger pentaromativorans TaxID=2943193 RepID=UPI002157BBF6|nr:cupin domain-containing protein [Salipiger pentaromativorans]MCR8547437.1 cupin domain-containing protein [Salipiger pentaromativorans]